MPKKLHWRSPAALQQPNIYIVNKLFCYMRLGAKFNDWRSLSKLIRTPGTGYRPPLIWLGVARAYHPDLRSSTPLDRHVVLSSFMTSNQFNFDVRGGTFHDVRGDQFNISQIFHNPGTEWCLLLYLYAQYMVVSYLGSKRPTSSCRRCIQPQRSNRQMPPRNS
jgi:hypothetical protein